MSIINRRIFCSKCLSQVSSIMAGLTIITREGAILCEECAEALHYCEICGSVKKNELDDNDLQLHFDEICFK